MNRKVHETIEVPQLQSPDKVTDVPVVLVAQVPQVQVMAKTVEIAQLPFAEKIVMIPEIQTVQGPQTSESLNTAKHSCKVACDTCAKDNMVIAAGEITVAVKFHRETVVRGVVPNIGIDPFIDDLSDTDSKGLIYKDCEVLFHVNKQSPDIAEGMHVDRDDLHAGNGDLWRSCSDGETQVTDPRKIHTAVTHAMLERKDSRAEVHGRRKGRQRSSESGVR